MIRGMTILFLILGLLMFTFAGLQLAVRRKNRVTYVLCALYCCLGFTWLYFGMYRMDRLAWAPGLIYSDVVTTFLFGPLILSYTRSLEGEAPRRSWRRPLPYVPALAVALYLLLFRPGAGLHAAGGGGINPDHFKVPLVAVLNFIGDAYFFCCLVLSIVFLIGLMKRQGPSFRKTFAGVLVFPIVSLLTFALFFISYATRNDDLIGIGVLINGIGGAYFFFLSYRYPEYTQRSIRPAIGGENKGASSLQVVDISRVLADLRTSMEEDKAYRDPDISLQSLSMRLGIQHYQLSQILNEHMRTSFRAYINRYRVEEAKRLLAEVPGKPVIEVVFAVGFNSKSAFHAVFKKETGLLPKDFRKKALQKVQD